MTGTMRPKSLLLVTGAWPARRLARVVERLGQRGEVAVVAFSPAARNALLRAGLPFRQPIDYADRTDEFDLAKTAIRELNEYPGRLVAGRPLAEWLQYQDVPLWTFLAPNLFADVNNMLKAVAILEKVIAREQPRWVLGIGTKALPPWLCYIRGAAKETVLIDRLAEQLCARQGLIWEPQPPRWGLRLRHALGQVVGAVATRLRGGMALLVAAALIRACMARAADLLVASRRRRSDTRPTILVFSHKKYWRKDYNPIVNRTARTDTAIYPVVHELLQTGRYQVVAVDGNYSFLGSLGGLWQKLAGEKAVYWQPFDTWYPLGRVRRCLKDLRGCEAVLRQATELSAVFAYQGLDLGRFFLPRLKFLIRDYLWKSAMWLEAGHRLVAATQPALVVLAYETGTLSRAIINACRAKGVPTLGLQHGAFSESTDDYVKSPSNHLTRFTPDKTAVWGERFHRLMVHHSAFREDEVVVTGNPRMDFLAKARNLLDVEGVYQKYHLDRQRQIVLVTPTETIGRTQHLAKDRFFEGVVAAQRALPECQWVVKLKPGADSEAYYQELIGHLGGTPMVFTAEDLYPLLVAAKVVVTPPSSIAIEALIVGKPVVYVVFPDAEDYFPHLSQRGAVVPVHEASALGAAIAGLLAGGGPEVGLADLQALLDEENYRPDGRAGERVVEVIDGLIAQGRIPESP